jgi:hypothetical protein
MASGVESTLKTLLGMQAENKRNKTPCSSAKSGTLSYFIPPFGFSHELSIKHEK